MKMLAGLRRWAINREVAEIFVPSTFGKDEGYVGRFMNKLGMAARGSSAFNLARSEMRRTT